MSEGNSQLADNRRHFPHARHVATVFLVRSSSANFENNKVNVD
jgi:hypothetical protein